MKTSSQSCAAWMGKLAALHPEDLTVDEQSTLADHLKTCSSCASVREQYRALDQRVQAAVASQPEWDVTTLPISQLEETPLAFLPSTSKVLFQQRREQQHMLRFAQGFCAAALLFFLLGWISLSTHIVTFTSGGRVAPTPTPIPRMYSVVGPSTLSLSSIQGILRLHHSPLNAEDIYTFGEKYTIDPTFVLALLQHESGLGTTAQSQQTKSPANLGCLSGYKCMVIEYVGFADFPDWRTGTEIVYKTLDSYYVKGHHLKTVDTIMPVYEAGSTHIAETIKEIKQMMDSWRHDYSAYPSIAGS